MKPSVPHGPSPRRFSTRGFATASLVAAIAAMTLAACGPRDETPLAGGSAAVAPATGTALAATPTTTPPLPAEPVRAGTPVPVAQTPPSALAPAPAYAPPPPDTVARTPGYPMQAPSGYAPTSQYAPVAGTAPAGSYQDAPPQGHPVPAAQPMARVAQAPVVPRETIGSITAIDPVRQRPPGSGAGAVIGGVLGGVIGNQFGHGLGRAAMTGVGAAGGAVAGNNVERNYKTAVVGYRVHVRLDNGSTRTFERKDIGNLHVGDRVRLDANGFRRA